MGRQMAFIATSNDCNQVIHKLCSQCERLFVYGYPMYTHPIYTNMEETEKQILRCIDGTSGRSRVVRFTDHDEWFERVEIARREGHPLFGEEYCVEFSCTNGIALSEKSIPVDAPFQIGRIYIPSVYFWIN